ncbi:hypothetical protein KHA80_23105 [Anaerobacillus sp. HL2]|nr:hypothetical protein KHA80_23105 [Anaerobacillus sp. HL2]
MKQTLETALQLAAKATVLTEELMGKLDTIVDRENEDISVTGSNIITTGTTSKVTIMIVTVVSLVVGIFYPSTLPI